MLNRYTLWHELFKCAENIDYDGMCRWFDMISTKHIFADKYDPATPPKLSLKEFLSIEDPGWESSGLLLELTK